jgi:sulfite exporter TauE/SafE
MCGPFLAFAAAGEDSRQPRWLTTGAYHGGRMIAYVKLGAIAGALGAGIERFGALAGVSRAAAIVAGIVMVAWGVDTLLTLRGQRSRFHPPAAFQRALSRVTGPIARMSGVKRAALTGVATALLPCGWLYAFVAAAGGTGSPARGALVMMFFWTGTLPVMAALGLGLQRAAGPLRRSLPMVSASVVVVIGLLTIAGRLRPALVPQVDHASHGASVGAVHR